MGTEMVKPDEFKVFMAARQNVLEIVRENMGGPGGATVFDLPTVKIPTGGATKWTVPTVTGEEVMPEIQGIIVLWNDLRAYWPGDFQGAEPPLCVADDGHHGEGDPSGDCATCPYGRWASDPGGVGQACKQMRRLFVVMPTSILPAVLTLPPTSIPICRKYFTSLTAAQVPYWGVVTSFTLEPAQNRAGIKYAKVKMTALAALTDEQAAKVAAMRDVFRQTVVQRVVRPDEYAAGEGEDAA